MKYSINKVLVCFLALGLIILAGILFSSGTDKVSREITAAPVAEVQAEAAVPVQMEQVVAQDVDPVKEARDKILASMGHDGNTGHEVSIRYTNKVSVK